MSDADPAKWNLALNNANNIQHDLGKGNVAVEIVAYGPGLAMLKGDSKVSARLAQALDNSIGLMACENTMRNTKTTKEEMYSGISYVDAGVVVGNRVKVQEIARDAQRNEGKADELARKIGLKACASATGR